MRNDKALARFDVFDHDRLGNAKAEQPFDLAEEPDRSTKRQPLAVTAEKAGPNRFAFDKDGWLQKPTK